MFQSTRPAWGATKANYWGLSINGKFQSTRPAWGATGNSYNNYANSYVSIHAPRVGRDSSTLALNPPRARFNPRAPRGARRPRSPSPSMKSTFQSTRPAWGATEKDLAG